MTRAAFFTVFVLTRPIAGGAGGPRKAVSPAGQWQFRGSAAS
eukprot:CAMPEP_0179322586 /NCGR_PEP_ID=MMETSP0797-20121207/59253_1 /TAXON_ID=47934 /ORGANISM="Dinophysis acuminata, Strain DAEP01" /LENGTH=41 /DNA_ID= /DNA_START= /DNA_END= /DNA_ORIENTATION=